jgi:16S rRNA C967 or C1407 C5-methylase (RsmB/RsmF family)/NOL1/NOP2/fmu family ribosome biogenesis protein
MIMMFPEKFIQRVEKQHYIDSKALLRALEEPSPISIRINTGKWNKVPADTEPVPWCKTGFYLKSRPSFTLDPLFHSGCYYPGEASGMFLGQIFEQVDHQSGKLRILDLCGAPGGKSTQLSDLAGPSGLLVANETIRSRASILAETIAKWGAVNTIVTRNDPAAFGKLKGFFDIILVDAPCSGEGMFRNRTAVEEWSAENAVLCAARQKRIITDIWSSLKESGILIYSTCTFNPDENEENIRWLIEKNEAECIRLDVSAFEGITEIDHHGIYGYGFFPNKVMGEGFFISVIRKTGREHQDIVRVRKQNDLIPVKSDILVATGWTGLPKERLLKRGDELVALPCEMEEFIHIFSKLNIVRAGTSIAMVRSDDYLPSHDLALSQLLKKEAFPHKAAGYKDAIRYLRRDTIEQSDLQYGWNLLTYNDVNIGFVKNLGKRVNNYFPVEWRIRMDMSHTGHENIIHWKDES